MLNSINTFYSPIHDDLIEVLKWFIYVELEPRIGGNLEEHFIWAEIIREDGRKACIYIDKVKDKWKIKATFYKLADYVDSLNNSPMYEYESSQTYENLGHLKETINTSRPLIVSGLLEIK